MCGIVKVHQEGRNKKMVTIGYAKYMDSDTYRRYLKAENSCRNMFHTNDVPAKPALEKRNRRKTKEHLGDRIKNIEEIMGVKYTKDTANRVDKCEVNTISGVFCVFHSHDFFYVFDPVAEMKNIEEIMGVKYTKD